MSIINSGLLIKGPVESKKRRIKVTSRHIRTRGKQIEKSLRTSVRCHNRYHVCNNRS